MSANMQRSDRTIIFVLAFTICWIALGFTALYPNAITLADADSLWKLAETFFVTLLAAWAGGWAAFRAERHTQTVNKRNERVSAGNKAIFRIAQSYEVFENLRRFYIDVDDRRQKPERALVIDSPQPGMFRRISFNFDELSFLLDEPDSAAVASFQSLMQFDWQLGVLQQTIELRAQAWEELHKALHSANVIVPAGGMPLTAIQALAPNAYNRLNSLTDQLIECVDKGLEKSREIHREFQSVLVSVFPGQQFLKVSFAGLH